MKTLLLFSAICIKLLLNAEASPKPVNMDEKITGLIGEHAVRSHDFVKGLKSLNITSDQENLKKYAQEDLHALATLRPNHNDYLFIPAWSSCTIVNNIYSNYNKTFAESAVDHSRFTEELAKRLEYFGNMINVTTYSALTADKELKEEQKIINNLFNKFITNLIKNFNQFERAADEKLGKLRAEIENLESGISEEHWKVGFIYWPFGTEHAENKKVSLEEETKVLDKFLETMKTYPNFIQEVKNDLSSISEDLEQNIQNTMDKIEYLQEWMSDTESLCKEVDLSEILKNQVLKHLHEAFEAVQEASCSTLKISYNERLIKEMREVQG